MKSEANIRQVREIAGWIEDEAFPSAPHAAISKCQEYLPPLYVEDDAEALLRRLGRGLRRLAWTRDQWLTTAYYEDHREEAACCVVLVLELQRKAENEEFWVDHAWLEEIDAVSVALLTRSIDLNLNAHEHSITCELRFPVYAGFARSAQQRNTLLLVEDENFVRTVTREVLETGGHRVLEAQDAEEALRLFSRNRRAIGMVISDVTLPGRTGRELARRLHGSAPRVPILLMSGYTKAVLEDASCHIFFLEKPYNAEVLLETVKRCLHASAAGGKSARYPSHLTESC